MYSPGAYTFLKGTIIYMKTINENTEFKKILIAINIFFNLELNIDEINFSTKKHNEIKY